MSIPTGNVGFIGLGAMGSPMAKRIAQSLSDTSYLFVYDVMENVMDDLIAFYPDKIKKETSPVAVAKQAVCALLPQCFTAN